MAAKLSHHLISGAFFLFLVVQALVVQSEIQFSNSLQFLQGAQKGYKVKGLNHVKQYFKAFGYYPNHINLTDDYDDSLESALKKYQENYRLKVTGRIDPDTIKEMLIPRCGVADIFNDSNSEYDKLDMVANYTFFDGMPKWSKRQLTYTFRSSAIVISVQQLRPIIARAFEKWAAVSQFTFRQAPTFTQADIVIGFHRRFHWDNYPFDGPGNVLAHAFAPQDGRFHYDADENWSTNPTTVNQIDVESVAVHEIGHLLGLGHSRDPNAIMFALYMPGTIKRNLGQDDIDGMRALYS
ncbi:Peptidase M10 [Theobroma cacao]|nr:Peptidase M10 [Theobroma cacao]